jgi:hypothetical protein
VVEGKNINYKSLSAKWNIWTQRDIGSMEWRTLHKKEFKEVIMGWIYSLGGETRNVYRTFDDVSSHLK